MVGMSDIRAHRMGWLAGYVYVGNGTLGATDSIYLVDTSKSYTSCAGVQGGFGIPVAGADSMFGATYIADVIKHFARMRINSQKLALIPLQPSTANSMTVLIAPQKGATAIGARASDTTAGQTYTNLISQQGVREASSFESIELDMTPFIGGGAGARQNEFNLAAVGATYTEGVPPYELLQLVPTTVSVSGVNSTTALRGTLTHAVFIEQVVDLIDYIGGATPTDPEGVQRIKSLMPTRKCVLEQKFGCAPLITAPVPKPISVAKATDSANGVTIRERFVEVDEKELLSERSDQKRSSSKCRTG
jgi:hypothetical protein